MIGRKRKEEITENVTERKLSTRAEIERIEAQIDALNSMRESFSDRFANLSERIGELRSMIVSHEQDTSSNDARAEKMLEIMENAKPEKIAKDMLSMTAKIEIVKGQVDVERNVMDRIIADFKDMRKTIKEFKGIENIQKLSEEVRDEITTVKKINTNVERNAEKTEDIFSEIRKSYEDYSKFKSEMEEMSEKFNKILEDFDKLKVDVENKAGQDEMENAKIQVDKSAAKIEELHELTRKQNSSAKKISEESEKAREFRIELKEGIKLLRHVNSRLDRIENNVEHVHKRSDSLASKKHVERLENELHKRVEIGNRRVKELNELKRIIRELQRKL